MRSEAPIISKALRLASVIVIVAVIALAASVGYSAYKEYQVLGGLFSQQQGGPNGQQGNSTQMAESLSGNQLSISGITIPNNMTYPLGIEFQGKISLGGIIVSTFSSPLQMIMPGHVGELNLSATANYTSIYENSKAIQIMLLNPTNLSTSFTIYAAIDPVAGLNVTNTSNSTVGPILGQFNVSPQTPYLSLNGSYVLPLQVSWNNNSPLQFGANIGGVLTQVPGEPTGNYGSVSSDVNVTQGSNQQTMYFQIPAQYASPNYQGQYNFNITVSAYGASVTIPESVNY